MEISIIIPTYNEGQNARLISQRIESALKTQNRTFEILFVDDSTDSTPEVLDELSERHPYIRYVHREDKKGLATAVIAGMHLAKGEILIVMDADLQHPPEYLPQLIEKIEEGYQMVIPSRFIKDGYDGGLNLQRKFISWTARIMARIALKSVRRISDPTSGFFAVRRSAIQDVTFDPIGWKIMLEIIIRAKIRKIGEIPYRFEKRNLGKSKMSAREQLNYIVHLFRLVAGSEEDRKFYLFCLVGLSGVVVNLIIYRLLLPYFLVILSFLISSFITMLTNYLLNSFFTWKSIKTENKKMATLRFLQYIIVSSGGLAISSSIVSIAHYLLHIPPFISAIVGIVSGILWNFILNDKWTFSLKTKINKHSTADGRRRSVHRSN